MDNQEILEKVLSTSTIGAGGGGILYPEQADRFIDYMWDETALTNMVRRIKMRRPSQDIDKVQIGSRLMRKATEGVDDHVNADPSFSKISMTTVKLRLDWALTTESLEDNLEGEELEDHVARLMATQCGNDLEDLYINGSTTSSDPLLKSLNGFVNLFLGGNHVTSWAGNALNRDVFNYVIKSIPRKYLSRRGDLRFFTSPGLLQDFLNYTVSTNASGDRFFNLPERVYESPQGVANQGGGSVGIRPYGVTPVEIPLFPETAAGTYSGATGNHGYGIFTFPQNMIVGVQREITVYREFKPKTDQIEYTVFVRVANQVENLDAAVTLNDIKVQVPTIG